MDVLEDALPLEPPDDPVEVCCYSEYAHTRRYIAASCVAIAAWIVIGYNIARGLTVTPRDEREPLDSEYDSHCCSVTSWRNSTYLWWYETRQNCCLQSSAVSDVAPIVRTPSLWHRCLLLNMLPMKCYVLLLVVLCTVLISIGYTHAFDTPDQLADDTVVAAPAVNHSDNDNNNKRDWSDDARESLHSDVNAALTASRVASPPVPCCFALSTQNSADNYDMLADQNVAGDHWAMYSGVQLHYANANDRLLNIGTYGMLLDGNNDEEHLRMDGRWPMCLHALSTAHFKASMPTTPLPSVSAHVRNATAVVVYAHAHATHTISSNLRAYLYVFEPPVCDSAQQGIEIHLTGLPLYVSELRACFHAHDAAPDFDSGFCTAYESPQPAAAQLLGDSDN